MVAVCASFLPLITFEHVVKLNYCICWRWIQNVTTRIHEDFKISILILWMYTWFNLVWVFGLATYESSDSPAFVFCTYPTKLYPNDWSILFIMCVAILKAPISFAASNHPCFLTLNCERKKTVPTSWYNLVKTFAFILFETAEAFHLLL